jgi:methyl-accepting chemotaxis protein
MDITGRMERVRSGARQRMMEMKADRPESQNDQLKAENRVLRDELEENRSERQRVMELLEKAAFTVDEPKKRRFRLFRLLLAAGAIYAVGTRTGAFDRVKGWINEMRGQMDEMAAQGTEKASEAGYKTGDVVEHTGRKIQKAGERVEEAGDRMEQSAKEIGTGA